MLLRNTPSFPCNVCYPCLRSVRPPGTTPRAGQPSPSLLHSLHGNSLHRPPRLPPLITLATQVTAPANKARATDAAPLNVTALRDRAVRAAATGHALLKLSIPPAIRLDRSQYTGREEGRGPMKTDEWKIYIRNWKYFAVVTMLSVLQLDTHKHTEQLKHVWINEVMDLGGNKGPTFPLNFLFSS